MTKFNRMSSVEKHPLKEQSRRKRKQSERKHTEISAISSSSVIYRNSVFPIKRIIPIGLVKPTLNYRHSNPLTKNSNRRIQVIDIEIEEALQQRRHAYREENHVNRGIKGSGTNIALIIESLDSDLSDADTVLVESEIEILP